MSLSVALVHCEDVANITVPVITGNDHNAHTYDFYGLDKRNCCKM